MRRVLATVATTSPLTVDIDNDKSGVEVWVTLASGLTVGTRVLCDLEGNRLTVIGVAGGTPLSPGLVVPVDIPAAANLNAYVVQGTYHQSSNAAATAGTNYPEALAGLLEVFATADGVFVYQRYKTFGSNQRAWTRTYYNGTWYAWAAAEAPWVAYTPTITGITIGNGTVVARYRQVGKTVVAEVMVTLGSTSSVTGACTVTLPVTAASNQLLGIGTSRPPNSGPHYTLQVYATNANALVAVAGVGTGGAVTNFSSTVPATWATGGWFKIQVTYEAA